MRPSRSFRGLWHTAVCSFLFVLLVAAAVFAEKPDQLNPQGYVNDFAGVLSQSAKDQLTALCTEVDQKAHAQIAVVTVKLLEGQPVEDFTINLATKWGVGPKQLSRGVMILVSTGDRQNRIEVGYGLEPILPDGKVGSYTREAAPYFRNQDYDSAILLMTRRVADVIAADAGVTLAGAYPRAARDSENQDHGWTAGQVILLLLAIFFVYMILRGTGSGSSGGRYNRGGGSGWWMGPMIGSGMGGGRGGWGGGGFGGSGGGGGFGGFGGGSFGGGGASGSW